MKTVAIIGAGPSGLIAARILLRSKQGQYKIRVFEKASEIGGLWAVHSDRPNAGMLNPDMPTNLSRFNIGFSDLAWSSVGIESHVHYWPKAWQVFEYLRTYVRRYIPTDVFSFNTCVTYAGLLTDGEHRNKWSLQWQSTDTGDTTEACEGIFDFLIVATGLFGQSSTPQVNQAESAGARIVHSTQLRKLEDLVPPDHAGPGTILVVGGGMSGGDASTVLANDVSDAAHSPSGDRTKYAELRVVQICPDKAYALPLAAPSNKSSPAAPEFLPLDLCMYQLGTRPPGLIEVNLGKSAQENIQKIHDAFQSIVGDQSDLKSSTLTYHASSRAPYVTLTEMYSGFVRSGDIELLPGRLASVEQSSKPGVVRAIVSNEGSTETIENVVGIVFATGFTPQPSLNFLDADIKNILAHDEQHNRLPIILDEYGTISHKLPTLAIVGFHEGAFWGSMEMEARLIEKRWSETHSETEGDGCNHDPSKSQFATLTALRTAMTDRDPDVPQYWLGDYVGLMETLAREVGLQRNDFDWPERTGPVSIYRYADMRADDATSQNSGTGLIGGDTPVAETRKALEEYLSVLERSKTKAAFAPRAAFLGMQGHWKIERDITSFLDTMPSGRLEGRASLYPRRPTSPEYDFEFLYDEKGTFTTVASTSSQTGINGHSTSATNGGGGGFTMQASRQYVYRYQESSDEITVWFVKADGRTVDYMYHSLEFDVAATRKRNPISDDHNDGQKQRDGNRLRGRDVDPGPGWIAKAKHLCIKDMYDTQYTFRFAGANIASFTVTHTVKGPKKDYVSDTRYSR